MKFLIVLLCISAWAHASGDPAAGKTKSATCVACHGANGISNNDLWPNLAGQKQAYLLQQLGQFRNGARVDPLMTPVAKMLSDAEMADIAAYFSGLKP